MKIKIKNTINSMSITLAIIEVLLLVIMATLLNAATVLHRTIGVFNYNCLIYFIAAIVLGALTLVLQVLNMKICDLKDEVDVLEEKVEAKLDVQPSFEEFYKIFKHEVTKELINQNVPQEYITDEKVIFLAEESYNILYGDEKDRIKFIFEKNNQLIELYEKIKEYDDRVDSLHCLVLNLRKAMEARGDI